MYYRKLLIQLSDHQNEKIISEVTASLYTEYIDDIYSIDQEVSFKVSNHIS